MSALDFRIFFFGVLLAKIALKFLLYLLNFKHLQTHAGNVPEELAETIDAATLKRIDSYNAAKNIFFSLSDLLGSILLMIFLFTPLYAAYTDWIDHFQVIYPIRAILFFGILSLIDWFVNLPLDYYFHFVIEARFGFNKYRTGTWLVDALKSLVINIVITMIILGFIFSIWSNDFQFKWHDVFLGWSAAVFLIITFMVLVPVLFIPFFYKLTPLPDSELKDNVTALVRDSGFKVRGVFVADESSKSTHVNAQFAGLGKTKTIILFDNLVNHYTTEEILGILAHEIGHGKKRHNLKLVAMVSLEILAFIVGSSLILAAKWPYEAMGISKILYSGGFFIYLLFFDGLLYFVQPFFSLYSRQMEYEADSYAKKALGTGAPLIATFKRFIADELDNINPHPWYEAYYYSHPSLMKRIKALE